MISFDLNTVIYRPLSQVFTFVATPENDFQWQYGTLASTQISEGTVAVGTLFHAIGHVLGLRIETTYEVTVFEPNARYGFKSVSGPLASQTLYTFAMIEAATKLDLSIETNPGDLFKSNDTLVIKKVRKQYQENLAMLKNVLEAWRKV